MTTITAQTVSIAGVAPTYQAITAGGDTVTLTTRMFLHIFNVSAHHVDVTVAGVPNIEVAIAAGAEAFIGPFDIDIYGPTLTLSYNLNGGAAGDTTIAALTYTFIDDTPDNIISLTGGTFVETIQLTGGEL